jgi:hypothetical protein
MPDVQAPTEEQVKAANEAEMKKWEGDFDPESLKISYSREESDKSAGKEDAKVEEAAEEEEQEVEQDVEDYEDLPSVVTTEDPGDYQAADYSFEVTLKDGKTHKVSTPEEADKLAEDPENFETPKQLMDFLTKANKMQRNLDRDFDKWESQKKAFDQEVETQQQREQTIGSLVAGFDYLVTKGLLPEVSAKDAKADWSDAKVAARPGVKEHMELVNYMVKENAVREKAGIPLLSSALDAYNAFKLEKNSSQEEADRKASGEARRAAGARVAGVSASNQAPYVPKGIAVGNPNVFKRSEDIWND